MQNSREFALISLEQSVEELALELSLRDTTSAEEAASLIPMLGQIRTQAASAGMDFVALIAATTPDTASAWQDTVGQIQHAVLECKQSSAQLVLMPLASLPQEPALTSEFIMEAREHLANVEAQLFVLERDPQNLEAINTIFRGFHTIKGVAGFLEFAEIQSFAHEVETLLDLARNAKVAVDAAFLDTILKSADHLSKYLEEMEAGVETASVAAGAPATFEVTTVPANSPSPGPRSVKVDTARIDDLVELAGELAVAQSLIQQDPESGSALSARLTRNLAHVTRLVADLQRVAIAMRMIPIQQLFSRMSRLVRDLARKSGKQASLTVTGGDTELDRGMVEQLADPLVHMLRNAMDHAAEAPDVRVRAGKSPTARLDLKAYHKGGFIHIEVCDDGRGLQRDKILAKARERGLLTGGEQLTEAEVFNLIFEPGFSTAENVTDVSGRGVGMDVVRQQIVKLRGRIEISSGEGAGTTFTIKLPLTMARIEGLIAAVGEHRYIIPVFAVKEMFRPTRDLLSIVPGAGEMVVLRGSLLPVLRLYERFAVVPGSGDAAQGILIVVESVRARFCVLVDDVIGKQDIVIKSLGKTFENIAGVAGGSILGDGRVGLILDMEALFAHSARD